MAGEKPPIQQRLFPEGHTPSPPCLLLAVPSCHFTCDGPARHLGAPAQLPVMAEQKEERFLSGCWVKPASKGTKVSDKEFETMMLGAGRGKGAEDFLLFIILEGLCAVSSSQKHSVNAFILGETWDLLVKLLLTRPGLHSVLSLIYVHRYWQTGMWNMVVRHLMDSLNPTCKNVLETALRIYLPK